MKPLVSILIPAYNSERFLGESIESALAQSWQHKEVIIVDDGSVDGTLDVARRYECKNVKVFSQINQSAASARNYAYSRSRGDYIQWLDADDLLAPDKIALQMRVFQETRNPKVLVSSAWGKFHFIQERAKFKQTSLWCDLDPVEWMLRKLNDHVFMQTAAWLVSREVTEEAGPWDQRMLSDDDGEYFARVLLKCDQVRFVPEARTYYRVRGADRLSVVGTNRRKVEALLRSKLLHIKYLHTLEDSERTRKASLNLLQTYLPYFDPDFPELVEEVRELSRELGGELNPVRLSWKYDWIRRIAGLSAAKRSSLLYNHLKLSVIQGWEHAKFRARC